MIPLTEANTLLENAARALDSLAIPETLEPLQQGQVLSLILQFRLDTEDALAMFVGCEQALASLLGLSKSQSADMLLERLAWFCGRDELHALLHTLAELVAALSKLLSRYRKTQSPAPPRQKQTREATPENILEPLKQATSQQQAAISALTKTRLILETRQETIRQTTVLQNIRRTLTTIRQNLLANARKSAALLSTLSPRAVEEPLFAPLLAKTHSLLQAFEVPEMSRFFHPAPPRESGPETLEARARAKRLRPFFG